MISTEKCKLWIQQFAAADRPDAEMLLQEFEFVDASTFRYDLSYLIRSKLPLGEATALYVEREEPRSTKRMYAERRIARGKGRLSARRAHGSARVIVRPPVRINQIVGSEGIVANIASQLARAESARFLIQPSADLLRERQVRHLVVVTDFIGSGARVNRFLSLLWNVRSIRSWSSYHKIRIWVFAYSATEKGRGLVGKHRSSPTVEVVSACPTIADVSDPTKRFALKALCQSYSPVKKESLGYKDIGALIAFAHGCPNDAPAIFHKNSKSMRRPWQALFPYRVTQNVDIDSDDDEPDGLELALDTLGFGAIKFSSAYLKSNRKMKQTIVLICAKSQGRRHLNSMTFATGLRLEEIEQLETNAIIQGLLGSNGRPTEPGLALLKRLQKPRLRSAKKYAQAGEQRYYPTSLRAPR